LCGGALCRTAQSTPSAPLVASPVRLLVVDFEYLASLFGHDGSEMFRVGGPRVYHRAIACPHKNPLWPFAVHHYVTFQVSGVHDGAIRVDLVAVATAKAKGLTVSLVVSCVCNCQPHN
jgi:hypothetical protein